MAENFILKEERQTADNTPAGPHKNALRNVCAGSVKVPVLIEGEESIRECANFCGAKFRWYVDIGTLRGRWKNITKGRTI